MTDSTVERKLLKQVTSVDFFATQDPDGPFETWLTNVPIVTKTGE